jgi:hypothetical protein
MGAVPFGEHLLYSEPTVGKPIDMSDIKVEHPPGSPQATLLNETDLVEFILIPVHPTTSGGTRRRRRKSRPKDP